MTDGDAGQAKWPGVGPAQAFIVPSYQWMLARLEAADSRIQALIGFTGTFTLGVPVLARTVRPTIPLDSLCLHGALLAFLVIAILGIVVRARGALNLANPATLYERYLHLDEPTFQQRVLYWAGQHFEKNAKLVKRKSLAVTWMTTLFIVEAGLFALWLVLS